MNFNGLAIRTRWFWISVLVVSFVLSNTFAYAENQSQQPKKQLEAWQEALLYSKDHPIITFAVHGRIRDTSTQDIGKKIKGVLASYNIESKYFLADDNHIGSSIEFFIQGVPYGPTGLSKVIPLIRQVVKHYRLEYPAGP